MTTAGEIIEVGSLRIHHTVAGERGSPLLLLHGLGSSGYLEWGANLDFLAFENRVFAPDLPGFGRSAKPPAPYGVAYFARFIDAYMDAVGLDSAVLVGASMGGRVALEVALSNAARVDKLVLVDALGLGRPSFRPYYPLLALPKVGEAMMGAIRLALNRLPPELVERLRRRWGRAAALDPARDDDYVAQMKEILTSDGYTRSYLATLRSLAAPDLLGGSDLATVLAPLTVPVLIIWGANDPLFPLQHAHAAHALLAGSRLVVIEGAGHSPQSDRPGEFNRALVEFVR
ncbi:MAG TPA: alpha/beta hydrolase [Candidatus Acidoferrales bacterium]|nr:alpha/beta hydrolase [Candidatus Acidoferrales bacterium]